MLWGSLSFSRIEFKVRPADTEKIEAMKLVFERLPLNRASLRSQFHREALQCLGLRFPEVLGLKWMDIEWDVLTIYVSRAIVLGRVDETKTEYSEAPAPLDPSFIRTTFNEYGNGTTGSDA
jgi:hypothetical protein